VFTVAWQQIFNTISSSAAAVTDEVPGSAEHLSCNLLQQQKETPSHDY